MCSLSKLLKKEMEKLLIKNISIWKWDELPNRNRNVTDTVTDTNTNSDTTANSKELLITGSLVSNSWISINQQGIISAIGHSNTNNTNTNKNTIPIPTPVESNYENVIDGKHSILLPGLMDSHIHVSGVGETAQFLNLGSCYSIFEFKVAIRKYLDIKF